MSETDQLTDQGTLIYEQDWNVLLVLDACRYDFFERQHSSYLQGTLSEVQSRGSSTPEFLAETFDEPLDDVVYVSANPFVSSEGETVDGFTPSDVFHEVIDVWKTDQDPSLGAVPPMELNESIQTAIEEYPSKRVIGHYIQPHVPFVSEGKIQQHSNFVLRAPNPESRVGEMRNFLDNLLKFKLGKGRVWKLKRQLGLPPAEDMEVLLAEDGPDGLRKAYRRNLDAVLVAIQHLLQKVDGDTVVTADHGELLGEGTHYGHKMGSGHPALRNVPWFRVNLEASRSIETATEEFRHIDSQSNDDGSKDVTDRLSDLGYV